MQKCDTSGCRFPGVELPGQRTENFFRLSIQNDKSLSRNFVPFNAPVGYTRECSPHSSLPILNICT